MADFELAGHLAVGAGACELVCRERRPIAGRHGGAALRDLVAGIGDERDGALHARAARARGGASGECCLLLAMRHQPRAHAALEAVALRRRALARQAFLEAGQTPADRLLP